MSEFLSVENSRFLDQAYHEVSRLPDDECCFWSKFIDQVPLGRFAAAIAFAKKDTEEDLRELDRQLAGQLFELAAHFYLSQKLRPNQVLLTPQETYMVLTGGDRKAPDFGESGGVKGVTMCDGLLLKRTDCAWQIERAYEYKASGYSFIDRTRRQMRGFKHPNNVLSSPISYGDEDSLYFGTALRRVRPDLPYLPITRNPKMKVKLVVPQYLASTWPSAEVAPVSSQGLRQVLAGIIEDSMWLKNY